MIPITATCDPDFLEVRDVASRIVSNGAALGLGVSVRYRGRRVVDVVCGHTAPGRTSLWDTRTLVPLTSISKTVLVAALLMLASDGQFKLDAPVARYWPQFGSAGKAEVTVRDLLSHRAGIPVFAPPITLQDQLDRAPVVARIEESQPLWRPGSAHGYHAITLGFALCELLRRIGGAEVGQLVGQTLADPYRLALHTSLGTTDAARLVTTVPYPDDRPPAHASVELKEYVASFLDPTSLLHRATFGSTAMSLEDINNPEYLRAERGHVYTDVATLADFYALLGRPKDEGGLMTGSVLDKVRTPWSQGTDQVFRVPSRWGLGFMLPGGHLWRTAGAGAFGHIGSAGSLAFVDPDRDVAFAFATNSMKSIFVTPDPRASALVTAAYRCIDRCAKSINPRQATDSLNRSV